METPPLQASNAVACDGLRRGKQGNSVGTRTARALKLCLWRILLSLTSHAPHDVVAASHGAPECRSGEHRARMPQIGGIDEFPKRIPPSVGISIKSICDLSATGALATKMFETMA